MCPDLPEIVNRVNRLRKAVDEINERISKFKLFTEYSKEDYESCVADIRAILDEAGISFRDG